MERGWLAEELSNLGYVWLNFHASVTARLYQNNTTDKPGPRTNKNRKLRTTKAFVTEVCWRVKG